MTFIFEVHGYRGFKVSLDGHQAMATLFFITFGGMAVSMPGLMRSAALDAIVEQAESMRQMIIKHGGYELFHQVAECTRKEVEEMAKGQAS